MSPSVRWDEYQPSFRLQGPLDLVAQTQGSPPPSLRSD